MKTTKVKAKRQGQEHKTILRTRQKPITTTMCVRDGCEFKGKPAVQGVCYSAKGEVVEWDKLDAHEAELVAELKSLRKSEGKDYVRALEAYYITAAMNWQITIDDCIRLRRDKALMAAARGGTSPRR